MSKETITRGLPSPVFRNETNSNQHILRGGTFVNETVATGKLFLPNSMTGIGTGGPFFSDRLAG